MKLSQVEFLLGGASAVKKNLESFRASAAALALEPEICAAVAAQLKAASTARPGRANTGLIETGWLPLAEVIGMISPRSTKLIIPVGYSPQEWKTEVLVSFLKTGSYPSSRTDGMGGSRAVKDLEALHQRGLTGKGERALKAALAALREVPLIEEVELPGTGDFD